MFSSLLLACFLSSLFPVHTSQRVSFLSVPFFPRCSHAIYVISFIGVCTRTAVFFLHLLLLAKFCSASFLVVDVCGTRSATDRNKKFSPDANYKFFPYIVLKAYTRTYLAFFSSLSFYYIVLSRSVCFSFSRVALNLKKKDVFS